ncbi:MAG: ABC transporter ATP-binding protein, partial [Acidimicrobiales bacterium]
MSSAIELQDVGKRYWQLKERAMLLRSVLPGRRPEKVEHWALRHLDLSVAHGETVGIMGRNGAGKTTLLRLLAGISAPTEGRIRIEGRVAALIGVGVGFHPEMTGRENVYVNAMLLGLPRAVVARRYDRIVAFSELEN